MQYPSYLKKGDQIGIVSTASIISTEKLKPAIELIEKKGFRVSTGTSVLAHHFQFAGTDKQRTYDLQQMLNNPEIKAIICSRGGYGTLRTIQNIDWSEFLKNPKWIVGFSDITVLHSQLSIINIASIHGVMPGYFIRNNKVSQSFEYLMDALEGRILSYTINSSKYNKKGQCEGKLIGGNLSILFSLRGTPYDIDTCGKILFIEDLNEYLYHLDRILLNLKTGGQLAQLSGLIVGGFTGMKDNENPFGKNVEEIILEAVKAYNYPVVFNFPAGHQINNFALKMGCKAKINVTSSTVAFIQ